MSQTDSSKYYYRSIHVISGFFALVYLEVTFFPMRKQYWQLANWNFSKFAGRIGYIGQIATGIFERDMFPLHPFAAAFFASGYISCLLFISFNLNNQSTNSGYNFDYIFFIVSISNKTKKFNLRIRLKSFNFLLRITGINCLEN